MRTEEHKSAKPRLIILSDLWGTKKSNWMTYYQTVLANYFAVKYYDVCTLGDVDKGEYQEAKLRVQFVSGGIVRAVEKILQEEKDVISILGFSIGGTIAWKASLVGLKVQNLYAVSSTRLRYETEKPSASIALFYGEDDAYKPDKNWFKKMELTTNMYSNEEHEFYQKREIAEDICKLIIKQIYQVEG